MVLLLLGGKRLREPWSGWLRRGRFRGPTAPRRSIARASGRAGVSSPVAVTVRLSRVGQTGTVVTGFTLAISVVVGLQRGSLGLVIGSSVGLGAAIRRLPAGWTRSVTHPATLWGLVAVLAVTVLRSLL